MIGAREELLNGVVLHQATDEPADKCNIYCEYPWCPPDSHCFVYVRHAPDHAPNTSAYIACDFGSWENAWSATTAGAAPWPIGASSTTSG